LSTSGVRCINMRMGKKIKLAHSFYNTGFPFSNTVLKLSDIYENSILEKRGHSHKVNPIHSILIMDTLGGFERVPLFQIKDKELFIYEITTRTFADNVINYISDIPLLQLVLDDVVLSDFVLDQVRNKNGYILLEWVSESYVEEEDLDIIYNFFYKMDIPINKVIYLTGSNNAEEIHLKYCKKKLIRNRLLIAHFEYYEWLSSYNLQLLEKNLDNNITFDNIKKTFLCFNNKFRHARADIYTLFYKYDLLKNSYFSMFDKCTHFNGTWAEYYEILNNVQTYRLPILEEVDITPSDIEYLNSILPLTVDDTSNEIERIVLIPEKNNLFNRSLISVITETNYLTKNIFHTEKTFKAVANKHPFIVVGPVQTLTSLKKMGYKTFSDYFDESYDEEEHPGKRILKIAKLCKEIDSWSIKEKENFYNKSKDITEHNFNILKYIYPRVPRYDFWTKFINNIRLLT